MFKRMKLKGKIGSGFGIMIVLAAILGGVGWYGVNKIHTSMSGYIRWNNITMMMNEEVHKRALKIRPAIAEYTTSPNDDSLSVLNESIKAVEKALNTWSKSMPGATELEEAAKEIRKNLKGIIAAKKEFQGFYDNDMTMDMLDSKKKMEKAASDLLDSLALVVKKILRPAMDAKISEANASQKYSMHLTLILSLVVIVAGILLAGLIIRSIARPIIRVTTAIDQGARRVAETAVQVSSASHAVAEGASNQAASIEETSSSMEEMSSVTKQNAESAGQANDLMKQTNIVVGDANDSMMNLTTSMDEISKASEETSKIIKTIDEIAFQTNLLALNAAVEAARAGEAGAGFAVVADEVRNLALRAAEAAKNTAELIEGTVKRVEDGSTVVSQTSESFIKVATNSQKVGELINEIAMASREQAEGIDQVNKAIALMDSITQQTSANAEETASAVGEMSGQAGKMKQLIQDLVSLIGGTTEKTGIKGSPLEPKIKKGQDNVIHPGHIQTAKPVRQLAQTEIPPSASIPLDEDEEFKNF